MPTLSATTQNQTMSDVMDLLDEASLLIKVVDNNTLQRVHLTTFLICGKVRMFVSRVLDDMSNMSDVLEIMRLASPLSSSYYVPTYVDEEFKYTDNYGNVYNARVLCIRDDEIDVIHTGTDRHYGKYTVNVHDFQFAQLSADSPICHATCNYDAKTEVTDQKRRKINYSPFRMHEEMFHR